MSFEIILNSEVDADSPLTQSLFTRLARNPLAIIRKEAEVLVGAGTWTAPTESTLALVIAVGGGAGGGNASSAGAGGGGGSSGEVKMLYYAITGGSSYSYACGAGGVGGAGDGNDNIGQIGGSTTFDTGSSQLIAQGGSPGSPGGGGGLGGNVHFYAGAGGNAGSNGQLYPAIYGRAPGTGSVGGGGGSPGFPFKMQNIEQYLGLGGDGGTISVNAGHGAGHGAGGGGGSVDWNQPGGNGSAGCIFILVVG